VLADYFFLTALRIYTQINVFNAEKKFQHTEITAAKSGSRHICVTSLKELKHLEMAVLTKDHLY